MQFIKHFPLFAVLLIVYNLVIIWAKVTSPEVDMLSKTFFPVMLPSGVEWAPNIQDMFILAGLVVLYIEILKSTSASDTAIIEHTFSMFVFITYLLEFLIYAPAADSSFLILCFMSLIDVVAGFTISISAARKDLSIG